MDDVEVISCSVLDYAMSLGSALIVVGLYSVRWYLLLAVLGKYKSSHDIVMCPNISIHISCTN